MSATLDGVNPSSPESIIASARALAAIGSLREAECMLRGALARLPSHGPFRLALMGLSVDAASRSWPPLSILEVEHWIRDCMLVEALAALCGCSFGDDGQRWANFLGELLAPPPNSDHDHYTVHQALLTGGASVAMTTLEDMSRETKLSPWGQRRLQLLRWMLIDNAQSATRDSQVNVRASPLAEALFAPLEARDLPGMASAAKGVDHPDAMQTARALERLAQEAQTQGLAESADKRTVQHSGRNAAAMQLHMTAFETARAVYEQMLTKAAEPEVAQLLVAVQGVERVLIGRPFNQRTFSVPKANRFEDVTVPHPEQRALASTPAAIGGSHEGLGFDDVTRVAASAEIPLAAFGDDVTRAVRLPESHLLDHPIVDEVTSVSAQHTARLRELDFDDVTIGPSSLPRGAPSTVLLEDPIFTDETVAISDPSLLATLDAQVVPQDKPADSQVAPIIKPLERANRNSVVVAAIVPVGTLEKTK